MAPAVLIVGILLIVPFLVTVHRSFYSDNVQSRFSGLGNYRLLFTDPVLIRSVENTLLWVTGTLVLPIALGLAIAVMTDAARWTRIVRLAVVIPYAISGSAVAVVWNFVLARNGALNALLTSLHLGSLAHGWLLNWPGNTLVIIVASTWQSTGVAVILFLVGLQTIPPETIEAASLDGADGWLRFRHIVLPQLRPVMIVVVGISLVNGLKAFDLIWVLTQGGPGRSTETLAASMYQETFGLQRLGAGSAIAVVLTIIVLGASWTYLRRQLQPEGA